MCEVLTMKHHADIASLIYVEKMSARSPAYLLEMQNAKLIIALVAYFQYMSEFKNIRV